MSNRAVGFVLVRKFFRDPMPKLNTDKAKYILELVTGDKCIAKLTGNVRRIRVRIQRLVEKGNIFKETGVNLAKKVKSEIPDDHLKRKDHPQYKIAGKLLKIGDELRAELRYALRYKKLAIETMNYNSYLHKTMLEREIKDVYKLLNDKIIFK